MEPIYERNIGALSLPQQTSLLSPVVCIVGCGGVGARTAELLLRAGVRHLSLIDAAAFQESDRNRHPFATAANVGRFKVTETKRRLLAIDPNAALTAFKKPYAPAFLSNAALCIDAVDQPAAHIAISETAPCPVLHARAFGYLVTVLLQATGETRLADLYPDARPIRHPAGKLGALDAFAASLLAAEAVVLLKEAEKPPVTEGFTKQYTLPYQFER